jgi:acyl-CoA synthetase (AMP-forming)/AMP-acid ligase II/3-hydroxymyristoyl/3-hydroxydecanoyl-(acyl carrier protein) dehydratase
MSAPLAILGRHLDSDIVIQEPNGAQLSAAALMCEVSAFRFGLASKSPGEQALLVCDQKRDFVVALLGSWLAGRQVALAPNGQIGLLKEWRQQHPDAAIIGTYEGLGCFSVGDLVASGRKNSTELEPPAPAASLGTLSELSRIRAQLAAISEERDRVLVRVWTSGTTGQHQSFGKNVTHLLGEASMQVQSHGFSRGELVVSSVPAHHIYGLLFGVLVPLLGGGEIFATTPLLPQEILGALAHRSCASLIAVPAHLRAMTILPKGSLAAIRRVISSSAPLPTSTAATICEDLGANLIEIFGSTETGGIAWRKSWPIGQPWELFAPVQVAVDEAGRMVVDSPFSAFDAVPGARRCASADRIELVDERHFRHVGRDDGVVKIAGKRTSMLEVENRILAIRGVIDAAVICMPTSGARGEVLAAVVVAPGLTPTHLRRELLPFLDPVVIPRVFRFVDSLPRATTGKVRREDLLAIVEAPSTEPTRLAILSCLREGGQARGEMYVPCNLVHFRGHFRSYPIVAAFVQIDILCELVRRAFGSLERPKPRLRKVLRLKFKRPIRPGDRVAYVLTLRGDVAIDFEVRVSEGLVAQGTLEFEGVLAGAQSAL